MQAIEPLHKSRPDIHPLLSDIGEATSSPLRAATALLRWTSQTFAAVATACTTCVSCHVMSEVAPARPREIGRSDGMLLCPNLHLQEKLTALLKPSYARVYARIARGGDSHIYISCTSIESKHTARARTLSFEGGPLKHEKRHGDGGLRCACKVERKKW